MLAHDYWFYWLLIFGWLLLVNCMTIKLDKHALRAIEKEKTEKYRQEPAKEEEPPPLDTQDSDNDLERTETEVKGEDSEDGAIFS